MKERIVSMKTWIDVVESQKPKKDMQPPYFTKEGWVVLALVAMCGGVIGAVLFNLMMSPFTK